VPSFATSPGTRDILPPDSGRWRAFQQVFADVVETAGYSHIIPPMFEDLGVFLRVGETTEIVTKEMYDFEDKGGRRVALRPEQTASVCRAFVEHRPVTPWKVWYAGPNFRYEKPQQGRYRQFDQVGIEALGVDDPQLDAEVISLAMEFYARLGLRQVRLAINSLGDSGDRDRYSAALRAHFAANLGALSAESQATLERNPLRVLDSKRDQDAPLIASAPKMADHLSDAAAQHFRIGAVLVARRGYRLRRRRQARARSRLLPPHDVRVRLYFAGCGAHCDRRRRALRRPRRRTGRPRDTRHRLRPRTRPHAARL